MWQNNLSINVYMYSDICEIAFVTIHVNVYELIIGLPTCKGILNSWQEILLFSQGNSSSRIIHSSYQIVQLKKPNIKIQQKDIKIYQGTKRRFGCWTCGNVEMCYVFFLFLPYPLISSMSRDFDNFPALYTGTFVLTCSQHIYTK